jgi:hypothetical protein
MQHTTPVVVAELYCLSILLIMKHNMNYFYTTKIDELYMRDRNYEVHLKKLA